MVKTITKVKKEVVEVPKKEAPLPDWPNAGRKEVADRLRERIKKNGGGLPPSLAAMVVAEYEATILSFLKEGCNVSLMGFGVFMGHPVPTKPGRNPATGKPMQIPAHYVAKFKPATRYKQAVAEAGIPVVT